jgi:uncharacterized membrane protein YebE (DUF533 family)
MFDPKQLLEQVLGASAGGDARNAGRDLLGRLDSTKGSHAFGGGAVTGGLLGMLLAGGGKRRGGLLGYGGAAALGALALQAYQTYQQKQQGGGAARIGDFGSMDLPHARPAADGSPFELVLVRAMVGAAKSDGHIDATEQRRLFAEVERLGLDADAKAYVFDLLTHDVDLDAIARAASTPEQGAETYLAARLAIDPDQPAERAYLDALAARLRLPAELRTALDGTSLS